ncbi:hypothetical protein ACFQFQ_06050 [Sulfitobacter porphyrae]|uniref:Transposase n=1 Tax=Sulfitobacter porphyrae TaxID=1246864 RepID=A0ABW2B0T0_9RHOB
MKRYRAAGGIAQEKGRFVSAQIPNPGRKDHRTLLKTLDRRVLTENVQFLLRQSGPKTDPWFATYR